MIIIKIRKISVTYGDSEVSLKSKNVPIIYPNQYCFNLHVPSIRSLVGLIIFPSNPPNCSQIPRPKKIKPSVTVNNHDSNCLTMQLTRASINFIRRRVISKPLLTIGVIRKRHYLWFFISFLANFEFCESTNY